jgi:hypothetical protein
MAIQTGLIRLRGKSGNHINFRRNGKYYTKSIAKSYRLSEGSKKSSIEFADASKVASLINKGFLPLRKKISDGKFIYRLNSRVHKAVKVGPAELKGKRKFTDGDVSLLEQVEFNRHTRLEKLIAGLPSVYIEPTELMTITIPETEDLFSAYLPAYVNGIIRMRVCSFDFKKGNGRFLQPDDLVFPLSEKTFPGATLEIPLDAAKNKVLVVGMAICFTFSNGIVAGDRRFYGGKILKAVNIKDGKIVKFVYPEKVVVENKEKLKENRIMWKLNVK